MKHKTQLLNSKINLPLGKIQTTKEKDSNICKHDLSPKLPSATKQKRNTSVRTSPRELDVKN